MRVAVMGLDGRHTRAGIGLGAVVAGEGLFGMRRAAVLAGKNSLSQAELDRAKAKLGEVEKQQKTLDAASGALRAERRSALIRSRSADAGSSVGCWSTRRPSKAHLRTDWRTRVQRISET